MDIRGSVHLYTGDGIGETTAALGLALKCCGEEKKVLLIQFMKKGNFSEIKALSRFGDCITIEQYGTPELYAPAAGSYIEHRGLAKKGYNRALSAAASDRFSLIILDDIISTLSYNL
ncbi:MAG: cob(I)yrinic acid a,c-diamide adenosyltransferase, partial [Spirochaetota bacterium]